MINPALSPLIGLGIVAIILVVILASFAAGKATRERALSRTLVEPVLIDVVLSISLVIELRLTNDALGAAPRRMLRNTYITVVATDDRLDFYAGVRRPRLLCSIPAARIATIGHRVIATQTRDFVVDFPGIVVTSTGSVDNFLVEFLPLRRAHMIPRKLTAEQLLQLSDTLASRLGVRAAG